MNKKLVSINFCGGCNPRIDRARIAEEVKEKLTVYGCGVVFNSLEADFIVYLSGCTSNCAKRKNNTTTPGVTVAAATIDAQLAEEEKLSSLISEKVRDYFEELERPLPK